MWEATLAQDIFYCLATREYNSLTVLLNKQAVSSYCFVFLLVQFFPIACFVDFKARCAWFQNHIYLGLGLAIDAQWWTWWNDCSGSAASSSLLLVFGPLGIQGCTWCIWWSWLSTSDSFISQSLEDLIRCSHILWHKLNAVWASVFHLLAAAECGHGKTKASSAGCVIVVASVFLWMDGAAVLETGLCFSLKLSCVTQWNFPSTMIPDFWNWFWQRRWICDISARIYEILFSAVANSFVVPAVTMGFIKNRNPALCSLPSSAQSFFEFWSWRPEMSNANAAAKVFRPLVLSLFFSLFILSISGFQSASKPCTPTPVSPIGLNAPVSITSITFAGFQVSPLLSASRHYLQHKDCTVCLTIRCLHFERLHASLPPGERKDQVLNI